MFGTLYSSFEALAFNLYLSIHRHIEIVLRLGLGVNGEENIV